MSRKLFEGYGKVAPLKERAVCCPSLGTHGGRPRRPLGLEVAQLAHRGLEVLSDIGGKRMQTRGAYESSKGYFSESKATKNGWKHLIASLSARLLRA